MQSLGCCEAHQGTAAQICRHLALVRWLTCSKLDSLLVCQGQVQQATVPLLNNSKLL